MFLLENRVRFLVEGGVSCVFFASSILQSHVRCGGVEGVSFVSVDIFGGCGGYFQPPPPPSWHEPVPVKEEGSMEEDSIPLPSDPFSFVVAAGPFGSPENLRETVDYAISSEVDLLILVRGRGVFPSLPCSSCFLKTRRGCNWWTPFFSGWTLCGGA